MILGSKIIISTERPVLDIKAKVLPSGVYTFVIDSLVAERP